VKSPLRRVHASLGRDYFYSSGDTHVRRLVEEALFHTEHLTQGLADHTTSAPALPDQNTRPA